jgi:ArsR family transcriptional regulator
MKHVDTVLATPSRTAVKRAVAKLPHGTPKSPFNKVTYERNAGVYKILAHPVRLEILNILKGTDCTVEQLLKLIPLSKANMSQHLALLRYAGVVVAQKSGLNVIYHIVDPRIVEPCAIMRELRRDPR